MGGIFSKNGEEIVKDEPVQGEIPSTPILTPKIKTLDNFDPRSPSANILRTPIQTIFNTPDINVEDSKCDTFNINSPAPKRIYAVDPRSPSADFIRTPIVLTDVSKPPEKLHNKNLDIVRKTLANITPKKISDMPTHVPPKLLESSPIKSNANENKRKSMIGVLETNLDCIETDLDAVIQGRRQSISPIKGDDLEADVQEKDVELAPTIPVNKEEERDEIEAFEDANDECISPVTIIDDDGLIHSTKIEELIASTTQINMVDDVVEEIQMTRSDSILIEKANTKVSDFDKKLSCLIYSDDTEVITPVKQSNVKDSSRTPLSDRNAHPRKTLPKLKVSDRPRKSEYMVSKIPVFKSKQTGLLQCENTPPRKQAESRICKPVKRLVANWDNDNTLII